MKDKAPNNSVSTRLHRQNALSFVNNVFMYLAGMLSNSVIPDKEIKDFISKWMENNIIRQSLLLMNSRLFLLFTTFIASEKNYEELMFNSLCENYVVTKEKSYVQAILSFAE